MAEAMAAGGTAAAMTLVNFHFIAGNDAAFRFFSSSVLFCHHLTTLKLHIFLFTYKLVIEIIYSLQKTNN